MIEKRCTKCEEIKTLRMFYRQSASRDGHMQICKACHVAYMAKKRAENRKPPKPLKIPAEYHQGIVDKYLRGDGTQESLAADFNASRSVVAAILRKHGIKAKPAREKIIKPLPLVGYNSLMGQMARVSLRVSA